MLTYDYVQTDRRCQSVKKKNVLQKIGRITKPITIRFNGNIINHIKDTLNH